MLRAQSSRKFELLRLLCLTQSGARGISANRKEDFSANLGNSGLKLDVMANPSSIITQISCDEEANKAAREKGKFALTLRATRHGCSARTSELAERRLSTKYRCYNVTCLHTHMHNQDDFVLKIVSQISLLINS